MKASDQLHARGVLSLRKPPFFYQFDRRLGRPRRGSRRCGEVLHCRESNKGVQSVARRYPDSPIMEFCFKLATITSIFFPIHRVCLLAEIWAPNFQLTKQPVWKKQRLVTLMHEIAANCLWPAALFAPR
jgi:hypothetical protein